MGKNKEKIKNHFKKSIITESLEKRTKSTLTYESYDHMVVSLKHLDKNQGHIFEDWEELKILSRAFNTICGLSSKSIKEQANNNKFTIYGGFPPKEKTDYYHPKHIPEDAQWARIHITGKQCVIGHVLGNVFFLVFLDGEHKFWKSELKNT